MKNNTPLHDSTYKNPKEAEEIVMSFNQGLDFIWKILL